MNKQNADALANWLARNQPQVFEQLYKAAHQRAQLSGITDWLSAVGTSVGTAAKSVGSFLTSQEGMATLGTIGSIYLQSQAQKDALKLQVANAQAGYAPANVQTVGANPYNSVPVYVDPVTGYQQPLTPQLTQQLMPPSSIMQYLPWVLAGGVVLLFAFRR